MGTCYYFWRDDNQTAFELGKAGELHALFEPTRPVILMPDYAETFAELWAMEWARRYPGGLDAACTDSLFRRVAADVIAWSEGQPIEYVDEHDGRIERAGMSDWDARSKDPSAPVRPYVTGTIYRESRESPDYENSPKPEGRWRLVAQQA